MNNFGVIEIASAKTTSAPGWAYVPDRGLPPLHAQPAMNRKRARTATNASGVGGSAASAAAAAANAAQNIADASARQEAKAQREIEILDRDNARDVHISIPARSKSSAAALVKKYTPNVRKIMQSQKTFANHLDDYVALGTDATAANTPVPEPMMTTTKNVSRSRQVSAATKPKVESVDVEMVDVDDAAAAAVKPEEQGLPVEDENDNNPLLATPLPPLPSAETMRALLAAPPLSYIEARGTWPPNGDGGQQYPTRAFCALCGYWGRVKCMKCGARVCALECLEVHREECVTRYGL